jgi:hypothetical protein
MVADESCSKDGEKSNLTVNRKDASPTGCLVFIRFLSSVNMAKFDDFHL